MQTKRAARASRDSVRPRRRPVLVRAVFGKRGEFYHRPAGAHRTATITYTERLIPVRCRYRAVRANDPGASMNSIRRFLIVAIGCLLVSTPATVPASAAVA